MPGWNDEPTVDGHVTPVTERARLAEADAGSGQWRAWGPYLSERAWGTVREDYSEYGTAWDYFPHDHARSRAYRWNEDGLAGICDDRQTFCFAPRAVERPGPDPQRAHLRPGRRRGQPRRGRQGVLVVPGLHPDPLVDEVALPLPAGRVPVRPSWTPRRAAGAARSPSTSWSTPASSTTTGTGRSTVDYAKAAPTDMCIRITVENMGPEPATLHVLPTLWFRNTWSWGLPGRDDMPSIRGKDNASGRRAPGARPAGPRRRRLAAPAVLRQRDQRRPAVGQDRCVALPEGRHQRPRRQRAPTRSTRTSRARRDALHYLLAVPAGDKVEIKLRLTLTDADVNGSPASMAPDLGGTFDHVMRARSAEADGFYADAHAARHPAGGGRRRPAGRRRPDVGQAVLPLRRGPLAGGRPGLRAAARGAPPRRATATGGT